MSFPARAEENSFIVSWMNVDYIVESWENLQKENFYFSLFIIATNTESERKQKNIFKFNNVGLVLMGLTIRNKACETLMES